MNLLFKYEQDKAITALLFICHKLSGSWDKYSLLKILYFAEKKHLAKYGRPITGDYMVAMPYGPVPSNSYNLIQSSPSEKNFKNEESNIICALAYPDMDNLSESDIECLEESIDENKNLSFGRLKLKSHDKAYNKTIIEKGLNANMSFLDIAESEGAGADMLNYIQHNLELHNCTFNASPNW